MKVLSTADAGPVSAFASDTLGAIARRLSTGPFSAAPSQAATASAAIHNTTYVGPWFPLMCSSRRRNAAARECGRHAHLEIWLGRPPERRALRLGRRRMQDAERHRSGACFTLAVMF